MPTSYAIIMVRAAGEQGVDLLEGMALTPQTLEAAEFMSLVDYVELLSRYTAMQDDPEWGFRFGEQLSMTAHGPLGFGAVSAPTVHDGLLFMVRYLPTRASYASARVDEHANALTITIRHDTNMDRFRVRACETLAVVFQSYIETAGASADPMIWRFPYSPPAHHEAYGRWLRGGCYFEEDEFTFEVPRSVSMVPSAFSNEAAYRSTMSQCEALLAELSGDSFETRVRSILTNAIECRALETVPVTDIPTADSLADQLDISRRTLIRRLNDSGTTFQAIRDAVIKAQIEKLVADSDLSLGDIAARLGYSEAANFTRACHRMFGKSPSALRQGINQKR
ncbi:MAG: AraC family transcriptional regulator ligand-binding domain-containing protein [Gammaproteobacteria bacterium]|nr:AraC family transcriptional regulator ligand-binding domain-containing protein [Gammaproteobacteria bacterium]